MYDMKVVGELSDEILERLKEIYRKQKQRYPIHDPDFLNVRANFLRRYLKIVRLGSLVFLKKGKLAGYLPYLERKILEGVPILKSRIMYLPIQLVDEDYSDSFRLLLRRILRPEVVSYFSFNFTDVHKDLERKVLVDHSCSREDFVTHVNYDWKVSKDIRYYVRKSIDLGCYVDSNLSRENFIEYYGNCMYESRRRKGIKLSESEQNPVGLYEFFERLVELDKGRMSFVKDENDSIVGGIFIVYNDQICVYFHAATSTKGLKKYAGYLNLNEAIEFCQQRGLIFDLFGTYKSGDRNYQNLYMFKRKWGEEFDVAEYRYYPLYVRIAKKMFEAQKKRRE